MMMHDSVQCMILFLLTLRSSYNRQRNPILFVLAQIQDVVPTEDLFRPIFWRAVRENPATLGVTGSDLDSKKEYDFVNLV